MVCRVLCDLSVSVGVLFGRRFVCFVCDVLCDIMWMLFCVCCCLCLFACVLCVCVFCSCVFCVMLCRLCVFLLVCVVSLTNLFGGCTIEESTIQRNMHDTSETTSRAEIWLHFFGGAGARCAFMFLFVSPPGVCV